ncbi:hypothetical protein MLD38_039802 [Melastoma candidum]|uniref:Uncharacterized protein n=1 Tax=Melastoma candidum TaxID=119954 RepID=A0ACB9L396_9MYRT|nr:hypothetical protein MLD38_039802 [Melastoma candidum]
MWLCRFRWDNMEVRYMAHIAATEYNKSSKSSLQMERVVNGVLDLKDDGKQYWMVVRCKDKDGNSKNYDAV